MKKREDWLTARREMLTASDVAAVLGADPRRGPLAVYEAKITGHNMQDNNWLKFGRAVETAIAGLYEVETDRQTEDLGAFEIQEHPDLPWLGATLDRITWRDSDTLPGPLELKHVGDFSRKENWIDEPPLHYQIQLQMQMACTNSTWGSLAGMFPGYQLAYRDFEFDSELLKGIYPILDKFWDRVLRKDPPPADVLPSTLDVVKRLYGQEDGEAVELECSSLADEWESAREREKIAKEEKKEIEIQLRDKMKTATFGHLNDGTMLTLKTTNRKAYTKIVESSSYRTLRRAKVRK